MGSSKEFKSATPVLDGGAIGKGDSGHYPQPTSAAVTAAMKGNRRRDTRPERRLRAILHARGLRYRCDYPIEVLDQRVRADIAFPSRKVAVFVDGCFWHSCGIHANAPVANSAYWEPKLARNRQRDTNVNQRLTAGGWTVVRIWEHVDATEAANEVLRIVNEPSK